MSRYSVQNLIPYYTSILLRTRFPWVTNAASGNGKALTTYLYSLVMGGWRKVFSGQWHTGAFLGLEKNNKFVLLLHNKNKKVLRKYLLLQSLHCACVSTKYKSSYELVKGKFYSNLNATCVYPLITSRYLWRQ